MTTASLQQIEYVIWITSELRNLCLRLRNAYLENEHERLITWFESYLKQQESLANPDADAILVGFRQARKNKDYHTIVAVEDRLSESFLWDQKEAGAYYYEACAKLKHQRGPQEP